MKEINRKVLLNVGLVRLEARAGDEIVYTLNMVLHISRDKANEEILNKTVLNPID